MSRRPLPKLATHRNAEAEHTEARGLAEARKATKKRKGKPSEHDAPPLTTFPGPKARELPGQLKL